MTGLTGQLGSGRAGRGGARRGRAQPGRGPRHLAMGAGHRAGLAEAVREGTRRCQNLPRRRGFYPAAGRGGPAGRDDAGGGRRTARHDPATRAALLQDLRRQAAPVGTCRPHRPSRPRRARSRPCARPARPASKSRHRRARTCPHPPAHAALGSPGSTPLRELQQATWRSGEVVTFSLSRRRLLGLTGAGALAGAATTAGISLARADDRCRVGDRALHRAAPGRHRHAGAGPAALHRVRRHHRLTRGAGELLRRWTAAAAQMCRGEEAGRGGAVGGPAAAPAVGHRRGDGTSGVAADVSRSGSGRPCSTAGSA